MGATSVCRAPPYAAPAAAKPTPEPEQRHKATKVAPATSKVSKLLWSLETKTGSSLYDGSVSLIWSVRKRQGAAGGIRNNLAGECPA
jgi:hypothetical protein